MQILPKFFNISEKCCIITEPTPKICCETKIATKVVHSFNTIQCISNPENLGKFSVRHLWWSEWMAVCMATSYDLMGFLLYQAVLQPFFL